ncbi:MAG: DUF2760 domain-containing protein [Methylococcales bacterium]
MNFDFTTFPEHFDVLHLAFASVALIECVLLVILLSLIVIGLMRRDRRPVESAVELKKPAETLVATKPAPLAAPVKTPVETPVEKPVEKKPVTPTATLREASPDAALQLLGLLQQEARFIDFIQENIQSYSDADIGAAARVVHEGCQKVIHNHFDLQPIRSEKENSRVTIKSGFDPATIRLTGKIVGKAPFNGTLVHRGWQVTDIHLPKLSESHNVSVVATAEVEL